MAYLQHGNPLRFSAIALQHRHLYRADGDNSSGKVSKHIMELAAEQPGILGIESARQEIGITVSYWSDLDAIKAWKENLDHRQAQRRAKDWYAEFRVRVCRVEREYGF